MNFTCKITWESNWAHLSADGTGELRDFYACHFFKNDREWARAQSHSTAYGIYFLFGPADEWPRRFYIGQAETRANASGIVNRMYEPQGHEKIADWEEGVMFVNGTYRTSSSPHDYFADNPNKLRYLENRFYREANQLHPAGCPFPHTFQIVNSSEPRSGIIGDEGDQRILDYFVQFCQFFLEVVGLPIFNQRKSLLQGIPSAPNQPSISPGAARPSPCNIPPDTPIASTFRETSPVHSSQENNVPPSSAVRPDLSEDVQMMRHHGRTCDAMLYHVPGSGSYVLCSGSRLAPITSATESTKRLRERYKNQIDSHSCTTEEIHFNSPNQAALFVCGTNTINANAFWQCSNFQSTSTTDVSHDIHRSTTDESQGNNVPPSSAIRLDLHENVKIMCHHGRICDAMLYQSPGSDGYVLGSGSRLAPITSATESTKRLRERFKNQIDSHSCTTEEIHFNSPNQAALFVCGTQTISANAFWQCSNFQSTNTTDVSHDIHRSTTDESQENNVPPSSAVRPDLSEDVQMMRHHGRTCDAMLYHVPGSGSYVLCSGSRLAPITSATESTKRLRERFKNQIDSNSCTTEEIHFNSPNQAALFVCGTQTINANAFWQCSNFQSTSTTDASHDIHRSTI